MACIASLATDAAKTAHAHVAQLLATQQVKPGDKLPLNETVKEADPTKPFALTPTGRNVFVRVAPPSFFFFPPLYTLCFYQKKSKSALLTNSLSLSPIFFFAHHTSTSTSRPRQHAHVNKYLQTIGWRAWRVHTHVQLPGARIH